MTNTGASTIVGDIGVSPGTAITGFPPGSQTGGVQHSADAVAAQAQADATTAYNALAGEPCTATLTDIDLGGLTLTSGVYCFAAGAQLTGTLTLNAAGNPDAVFIFKMGSTLTTASNSSVVLINGADNCDVFWQVGSSATIGTNTTFVGTIIALTSITVQTGASIDGRALARNGAVTLDTNHIENSTCAEADAGSDTGAVDSSTDTIDTGTAIDSGTPIDSGTLIDTGIPDLDTGATTDTGTALDTGTAIDTGVLVDSGTVIDTGVLIDSGTVIDTGVLVDSGSIIDTGVLVDSGSIIDSGVLVDSGSIIDTGVLVDSGSIIDTGTVVDTGTVLDTGALSDTSIIADTGHAKDSGVSRDGSVEDTAHQGEGEGEGEGFEEPIDHPKDKPPPAAGDSDSGGVSCSVTRTGTNAPPSAPTFGVAVLGLAVALLTRRRR